MRTLKSSRFLHSTLSASKRGDTIIEVMFAIAVFSLVAVVTISMMNLGTANAEGALELATARNELNSQAEALRFVHSAYTAELALPECSEGIIARGEKCQQYKALWETITHNALPHSHDHLDQIINITDTLSNSDNIKGVTSFGDVVGCERAYTPVFNGHNLLVQNNAFVLNVRDLSINSDGTKLVNPTDALIYASNGPDNKFVPTSLSSRILYASSVDPNQTTDDGLSVRNRFNRIAQVEGLWVVATRSETELEGTDIPAFYDFYIQTCWNAPNSLSPTILDTVIRLYNPGAKS